MRKHRELQIRVPTASSTRVAMLRWLQRYDRNGVWTDKRGRDFGYPPLSKAEARKAVKSFVRDMKAAE